MDDLEGFIQGLPKAELHVHLEGCLTPDLAARLAKRNNMNLPESVSKASSSTGFAFHDLISFLAVYYPAMSVLQTPQDFHDLAMDYLTIAHSQNIRHCELFFDPQAHTSRGVTFSTVVEGYSSALTKAQTDFGISCSLIMCFLRDHSADSAMTTLTSLLSLPKSTTSLITGIGLDSDERNNPPSKFTEVFALAREHNYNLTAHCDIDQQNTLSHIHQALHDLKVHRLDHGTNIIDSPDLIDYAIKHNIGLTTCPISNSIVTSDFKGKEILELLREGVKVTVNSDDPAYFRGYLSENLLKLVRETDVMWSEVVRMQRNAFEISWVDEERRVMLLRELCEYARKYGLEF
ncbi:hypothetical protein BT93_L5038 [Corymbia citriodora subsp. variegata]|uniref:Adenosine deaminase domain-containing protein n=1 Tax=Corymbia citriodora subsp. variegata TaxID=360336 RepID=A0A8T0CFG6_CORYI|nr:hypothetical protein BT93_L5038 [Corymbia citriodora subsp. variegata]